MKSKTQLIIGWIVVIISILISGFWALWGIIENFHEGWYHTSLITNIAMMFGQYLFISIIFIILAIISIFYKKIGAGLFIALGIFAVFFFSGNPASIFIMSFLALLGLGFYFSKINNKKLAISLIIGIPLLIILGFGIPLLIKVEQRINDNDFGLRVVEGNDITLAWAPRGPGFPERGINWTHAVYVCAHLSEDGVMVIEEKQGIWRLPTISELVRSQARHGKNSGGIWNPETKKASYEIQPDKETPLWDPYSMSYITGHLRNIMRKKLIL